MERRGVSDLRWLNRFRLLLALFYFCDIRVYGRERVPVSGMTLFVSNHRNGAIDGYVLLKALPACRAIVGRNLTGSWFLRLFFGGQIEVYRRAETAEQRAWNRERMREAASVMRRGEPVLIFPEGTSKLGPSLLPIKKGAALICRMLLEEAGEDSELTIVPLGLHYEEGWRFRSAAEIHVGQPVRVTKDEARNLTELTETIRQSLMEIAENFANEQDQRIGEAFATMLRYHGVTDRSHLVLCRMWAERKIPEEKRGEFLRLYQAADSARYQGAPLAARRGGWASAAVYWLLSPLILLALMLNMLPLAGGYAAARKMADDRNVIALWRILVGTPLFVLQWVIYILVALLFCPLSMAGWLLIGYAGLTGVGCWLLDVWRRAGVRGRNRSYEERQAILLFCEGFMK